MKRRKPKIVIAQTGTTSRMFSLPHINISSIENHSPSPQYMTPTTDEARAEIMENFVNESTNRKCVYTYEDKYTFSRIIDGDNLVFDSHFESGNLYSAFKSNYVTKNPLSSSYDLYIHSDLASAGHTQWFYFSVANAKAGAEVNFIIRNFAKPDSLFNEGMRPLMYSVKSGRGWERAGNKICYFSTKTPVHSASSGGSNFFGLTAALQSNSNNSNNSNSNNSNSNNGSNGPTNSNNDNNSNINNNNNNSSSNNNNNSTSNNSNNTSNHANSNSNSNNNNNNNSGGAADSGSIHPDNRINVPGASSSLTYSLCFTHVFEFSNDTVYFAYSLPYTYTDLQRYLIRAQLNHPKSVYLKREELCKTLAGNSCDVLTITAPAPTVEDLNSRVVTMLSARVHPGETNSSWIMQGILDFLLSDSAEAAALRERFIFKVIPMLNPDGVINGHYRTSLSGCDLNRRWSNPSKERHPTIFHMKELIKKIKKYRPVSMMLDVHGHSRKQGIFVYGCVPDKKLLRPISPPVSRLGAAGSSKSVSRVASKANGILMGSKSEAGLSFDGAEEVNSANGNIASNNNTSNNSSSNTTANTTASSANPSGYFPCNIENLSMRHVIEWRVKLLPRMLTAALPNNIFTMEDCSFKMQKSKINTMRIVAYTELGVDCVYTLEASLCGRMPFHFTAHDLVDVGKCIMRSMCAAAPSMAIRGSEWYNNYEFSSEVVKHLSSYPKSTSKTSASFDDESLEIADAIESVSTAKNPIAEKLQEQFATFQNEILEWRDYYDVRSSGLGNNLITEFGRAELFFSGPNPNPNPYANLPPSGPNATSANTSAGIGGQTDNNSISLNTNSNLVDNKLQNIDSLAISGDPLKSKKRPVSSKAGKKPSSSSANNLNSLLVTNAAGGEKTGDAAAESELPPNYSGSRGRKLSKQLDINFFYPEGESNGIASHVDESKHLYSSTPTHINLADVDIPAVPNSTKRVKSAKKSNKPSANVPLEKPSQTNDVDLLITQKKIIISPVSRDEQAGKVNQRPSTSTDDKNANILPPSINMGSGYTSATRRPSSGRRSSVQSAERKRSTGVLGLVSLDDPNGGTNFVLAAVPAPTPSSPSGPPKVTGAEISLGQRESQDSPNTRPGRQRPMSGGAVKRRSVSSGEISFNPTVPTNPKPAASSNAKEIVSSEPSIIQNFEKFFKNSTLSQAYAALPDTLSSNLEQSSRPQSGYKSSAVPVSKQYSSSSHDTTASRSRQEPPHLANASEGIASIVDRNRNLQFDDSISASPRSVKVGESIIQGYKSLSRG